MIAISAAAGYQLWAETWDSTPSPIVSLEQRTLLPWVERLRARRAVDIGCGTGRWTARLNAIGFDASPAMLAVAAHKPELRGRIAVADAMSLPIAPGCCDVALCALTLGHIRDGAAVIRELARIIEPGGSLLLSDFHPAAVAQGWRRTFRREGVVYELENYAHSLEVLQSAAPHLSLEEHFDASIGEPERDLFERAGKPELFEAACGTPAVLVSRWKRL